MDKIRVIQKRHDLGRGVFGLKSRRQIERDYLFDFGD
jgi:hypothetical protein